MPVQVDALHSRSLLVGCRFPMPVQAEMLPLILGGDDVLTMA